MAALRHQRSQCVQICASRHHVTPTPQHDRRLLRALPSREDALVSAECAVAQQDSLHGGQVCSSHPTPQPTVEGDMQDGVEAVVADLQLLQMRQGYASTNRATATG